ncbi:MAG TPA: TolC family protein [Candidatus Binatia bacterium]|jgi:outer membrane protein TolC|nr:TolC family protein [Candidatus Binatia bacterium]
MRLFRIWLVLAAAATAVPAQTNTTGKTDAYGISGAGAGVPGPTNSTDFIDLYFFRGDDTNASPLARPNGSWSVRRVSLQDCIQLALQHNLDLQIDRYNPEISLYNLRANYGDYDPTWTISGQHDHNESGTQVLGGNFTIAGSVSDDNSFASTVSGSLPWGTTYNFGTLPSPIKDTYGPGLNNAFGSVGLTMSQPLLKNFWINTTRLNIRVAKNRLKYTEQALRLQIMQTVTTLEQAYYDLIYNRENVIVQQKAVELAERLVAENKKRLEVGALAPLDLQSAEAQAASSRAAVIQAKNQLGTQDRLVKQLLTDRYLEWANVVLDPSGTLAAPPPVLNLQDSWSQGLAMRPELLQAKMDVEKQGIQLKYDHNQIFPELDAFGTFGYNGAGPQFSDALDNIRSMTSKFYTYGGRISIPLSDTRTRNTYKADKVTMQQLVLTLKKLEETVMVQIDNDIGSVRAGYDQVQATRTARQYQESALDAEQKKLESGKSTTYNVLLVQRDLTTARGNEIQALDTYNKSLSQLSLDEGSTLRRLGINYEVK